MKIYLLVKTLKNKCFSGRSSVSTKFCLSACLTSKIASSLFQLANEWSSKRERLDLLANEKSIMFKAERNPSPFFILTADP